MNSSRPYLVRALYEWIVDNDCTPHMLVNAEFPAVQVPQGFASDGQIVLNISPSAVRNLHMDNDAVSFEGRFSGVAHLQRVGDAQDRQRHHALSWRRHIPDITFAV